MFIISITSSSSRFIVHLLNYWPTSSQRFKFLPFRIVFILRSSSLIQYCRHRLFTSRVQFPSSSSRRHPSAAEFYIYLATLPRHLQPTLSTNRPSLCCSFAAACSLHLPYCSSAHRHQPAACQPSLLLSPTASRQQQHYICIRRSHGSCSPSLILVACVFRFFPGIFSLILFSYFIYRIHRFFSHSLRCPILIAFHFLQHFVVDISIVVVVPIAFCFMPVCFLLSFCISQSWFMFPSS